MALASSLPSRMALSTGTVYYVGRVSGDDTRSVVTAQTKATPWKTIQGALNKLASASAFSNAILKVIPDNVYTELMSIANVRPALPFTITADYTSVMGDLGSRPRLTQPTNAGGFAQQGFKFTNCNNIRISYLNFQGDPEAGTPVSSGITLIGPTGGASDRSGSPFYGSDGGASTGPSSSKTGQFEIDHCVFLNTMDQAIYAGGNTNGDVNDLHVTNNVFDANGRAWHFDPSTGDPRYYYPSHTHCLYLAHCWRTFIANNRFADTPAGNTVKMGPECSYAVMTGNTIAGGYLCPVSILGDGNVYSPNTSQRPSAWNLVINNCISNHPSSMTRGSAPAAGVETFTTQNPLGNGQVGAGVGYYFPGTTPANSTVRNNNFWHTGSAVMSGGPLVNTGNFGSVPSYVKSYDGTAEDASGSVHNGASVMFLPTSGHSAVWSGPNHYKGGHADPSQDGPRDLRLNVVSSLVGKAIDTWLPLTDLLGTSRSTLTLGAYEGVQPSGGSTPPQFVQELGHATSTALARTLVLTLTSSATQGNTGVLHLAIPGNTLAPAVTDSRGNTWTVDLYTPYVAGGECGGIAHALLSNDLNAGDTITVTFAGTDTCTAVAVAEEFSGAMTPVTTDGTAGLTAAGTVVSSGALTPSTVSTICVGQAVATGTQTFSHGTGWQGYPTDNLNNTGAPFVRTLSAAYKILSAATATTYDGTVASTNIISMLVLYKGNLAAAPSCTVTPAVTGTVVALSSVLTCSSGTWTGSPTFTYQWQRDNAGGGTFSNIAAATASTYTAVRADLGCQVRCSVTGTNGSGVVSATSNVVGLVSNIGTTMGLLGVGT